MTELYLKENKGLVDVEFRLNKSETSYHKAGRESKFLNESLFYLFASCFANSVDHDNRFNYFGPTKYRKNEQFKLRACLGETEVGLKAINSFNKFAQFIESNHLLRELGEEFDLESEWDQILQKIIEICRALIGLVSRCIRERRTLWVLGI